MTKEEIDQLLRFYSVDTLEGLVEAQAQHVEKLQAKIPSDNIQMFFRPPREG
jgi:hypothetical protein